MQNSGRAPSVLMHTKHVCAHTHLHTLKGSLALGQGISAKGWSWTRELIASQAGQLQSGAREAPPCLPRSKASFSKALFAFCSLQQLNSTQKSLFLPLLCPLFSLFTFSDSAALWQLIQLLCTKGNYVLNWIIGSFLQMSAHPPTQPQTLNPPPWDRLSGTCFQTPQSAGWAWNGNLGVCYSFML